MNSRPRDCVFGSGHFVTTMRVIISVGRVTLLRESFIWGSRIPKLDFVDKSVDNFVDK